ncbi:MAG: hydroxymethylglutaryl-CoA lyase [Alphaproteobacteria bacterium]|nr:hydroxymethylglutaryl-CoA lyase [Alphaproteobacteria bacterium]
MILNVSYFVFLYLFVATHLQACSLAEFFSRGVRALPRFNSQQLLNETAKTLGVKTPSFHHSFANLNEVGARDGLQNEARYIELEYKLGLIDALVTSVKTPVKHPVRVEVGSMVSSRAVPQMKSTPEVIGFLEKDPKVIYSVLVPNLKGMTDLREVLDERGDNLSTEVAVFVSPSERFSEGNLKCSVADSLRMAEHVMAQATKFKMPRRGFISMIAGSPLGDTVTKESVRLIANALRSMGCQQIVLADTTGVGTPAQIFELVQHVSKVIPLSDLALHLHGRADNWQNTLRNVLAAYMAGIRSFDGSVGGIGGCPYSPGSPGNIDTALLLTLFEGLGIKTDWNRDAVLQVRSHLPQVLGFRNVMVKDRGEL